MNKKHPKGMNINYFKVFNKAIAEESDRAKVVLVVSWIDNFLEVKLKNEFSKGNAKARKQLFTPSGPFSSFSAKLNTVFCAGWIDADVHHDVQKIRKLRNDCAHAIEPISLNDENIRSLLESLHVPRRQYYDWGELKAASTNNGILLYTGEKPEDAEEDLYLGVLTFNMAISLIVAVLLANLEIPFTIDEKEFFIMTLPKYMEIAQEDGTEG